MREADATQVQSWERIAMERGDHFEHFYHSTLQLSVCGKDPMWRVRLTLDEAGPYWGWLYSHHPANGSRKGEISMTG